MPFSDADSTISSGILLQARNGNDEAWRRIWTRYSGRVFRQASRFGIAPADAEDVTVEVFRKVWAKLDDFSRNGNEQSLGAWINRITQTTTLDFLRRQQREIAVWDSQAEGQPMETSAPGDCGHISPVWLAFWQALGTVENEIPERNWECFQLARFAGLPHSEIGKRLGISSSNVSTTVRRVFEKIRDRAIEHLNSLGFQIDENGRLIPENKQEIMD